SEAARRRLLKHAFRDEMTNNSLQRLAISPRRASQLTDLLLPGEDVVSNSQSRSNMHAPRRRKVDQGPQVHFVMMPQLIGGSLVRLISRWRERQYGWQWQDASRSSS